MRIVITGGAGFLGVRLARALLARDTLTEPKVSHVRCASLCLLDVAPPPDLGDSACAP
jgi:nucleoside-diphosphate-sugar epimerase